MVTIPDPARAGQSHAGTERRRAPRLPADYPVRVRCILPSGAHLERYAKLRNVSAEGLLFHCAERLEPGMRVSVSVAIPYPQCASLPAAQVDAEAVVMRCEPSNQDAAADFGKKIALKFLTRPVVLTEVSMFE
ncbi:MAG: hypothetical protein Kow0099_35060 [Candidatus Abyssubacteria bacterium]